MNGRQVASVCRVRPGSCWVDVKRSAVVWGAGAQAAQWIHGGAGRVQPEATTQAKLLALQLPKLQHLSSYLPSSSLPSMTTIQKLFLYYMQMHFFKYLYAVFCTVYTQMEVPSVLLPDRNNQLKQD